MTWQDDIFEGTGTWRDIATGVDPAWGDPLQADGANDGPGDPGAPINTRLEGPWGVPWFDAFELPYAVSGLVTSQDPQMPVPDRGASPIVGAYEGAYRTMGPVQAWGYEVSGGLGGDQAYGRIMRFPANIPDRSDPNGVWNTDFHDDMSAAVMAGSPPFVTDDDVINSLLSFQVS